VIAPLPTFLPTDSDRKITNKVGPTFVQTRRPHHPAAHHPVGPNFTPIQAYAGAKSGDHTQTGITGGLGQRLPVFTLQLTQQTTQIGDHLPRRLHRRDRPANRPANAANLLATPSPCPPDTVSYTLGRCGPEGHADSSYNNLSLQY